MSDTKPIYKSWLFWFGLTTFFMGFLVDPEVQAALQEIGVPPAVLARVTSVVGGLIILVRKFQDHKPLTWK